MQQGKCDEAIADFNEAIQINPQDAKAYTNRGNAKVALDQHDDAIADYDQAIRIHPQFAEAYSNRGNLYREMGAYEKARTNLQRALELATEQGNQELARHVQRLLDQLPPADGELQDPKVGAEPRSMI